MGCGDQGPQILQDLLTAVFRSTPQPWSTYCPTVVNVLKSQILRTTLVGTKLVYYMSINMSSMSSFRTSRGSPSCEPRVRVRVSEHETLVSALRSAAKSDEGVTLVGQEDQERFRTYQEIFNRSLGRAAALCASGLQRDDRVVLILNTSFEFIEAFFGIVLAGGIPVPAYPPLTLSRLDNYHKLLIHIVEATSARFLVTDRLIAATCGLLYKRCPSLCEILAIERMYADPAPEEILDPLPDDPCFIQCTSGSTAAPKPVVLSHHALLANLFGVHHDIALSDDDVYVSWLPLYHDFGLIGALLGAVCQAIHLVLLPPDLFLMDPAAWWRAISRHRGTVTAGPNFAYGLSIRRLDPAEVEQMDLSSLRVVINGAEPVQLETMRQLAAVMRKAKLDPAAFVAGYGLAESCLAVSMSPPEQGIRLEHISREALSTSECPRALPASGDDKSIASISVGYPIAGTSVQIVGPSGDELPDRHVGEICILGPSLMSGYLNHPRATREILCDGVLHSGDLGYTVAGELFLVGRTKDMLIVRGKNYFPEDIEAVAERVPGVRKGNVVAYGTFDEKVGHDRLHVIAETRHRTPQTQNILTEEIRASVFEAVGLSPSRIVLVPPGSLPKTSSGKKRRSACQRAVASREIFHRRSDTHIVLSLARDVLLSQLFQLRHWLRRHLKREITSSPLAYDG